MTTFAIPGAFSAGREGTAYRHAHALIERVADPAVAAARARTTAGLEI